MPIFWKIPGILAVCMSKMVRRMCKKQKSPELSMAAEGHTEFRRFYTFLYTFFRPWHACRWREKNKKVLPPLPPGNSTNLEKYSMLLEHKDHKERRFDMLFCKLSFASSNILAFNSCSTRNASGDCGGWGVASILCCKNSLIYFSSFRYRYTKHGELDAVRKRW